MGHARERISLILVSIVVLFCISAPSTRVLAQSDTTRIEETDTSSSSNRPLTDSINQSTNFRMTKDPVAAVLWGLIPGGGQVYTEQYWKVPVFVVPMAVFTGLAIHFEGKRGEFAQLAIDQEEQGENNSAALSNRNANQDRRDLNIAIAGGVFLLSLVDAYVGAHLYDFDVGDSLAAVRVYPVPDGLGIGMTMRW